MNVTVKQLSQLTPLKKNVRRHTEKQITEYMRSLEMFKQVRPVVVDEGGVILIGNGMYEAMKRLGWETCDCYVVEGLSENEKTKLMLADNRVYELGMTDMEIFDELIRGLGDDLDVPGWEEDLLQTLTASLEEADAMVESYGTFDPDEVSRMNERRQEAAAPPATPEDTFKPLQRPSGESGSGGQVSDRVETETATAPMEAPEGRFVVCPRCGERIALATGGIGGM